MYIYIYIYTHTEFPHGKSPWHQRGGASAKRGSLHPPTPAPRTGRGDLAVAVFVSGEFFIWWTGELVNLSSEVVVICQVQLVSICKWRSGEKNEC